MECLPSSTTAVIWERNWSGSISQADQLTDNVSFPIMQSHPDHSSISRSSSFARSEKLLSRFQTCQFNSRQCSAMDTMFSPREEPLNRLRIPIIFPKAIYWCCYIWPAKLATCEALSLVFINFSALISNNTPKWARSLPRHSRASVKFGMTSRLVYISTQELQSRLFMSLRSAVLTLQDMALRSDCAVSPPLPASLRPLTQHKYCQPGKTFFSKLSRLKWLSRAPLNQNHRGGKLRKEGREREREKEERGRRRRDWDGKGEDKTVFTAHTGREV